MKEIWDILTLCFREWPTLFKVKKLWKVEFLMWLYYLVRLPSLDIWLQRRLIDRDPDDFRFGDTPYQTGLKILQKAKICESDLFLDLGSGRGKMVFLAALSCNCQAVGVELLPSYNILCNRIAKNVGLGDRVQFVNGDFLEYDLTGATVIFTACTTWSQLTRDLLLDRVEELPEGTRWISAGQEQRHPDLNLVAADTLLFSWGYEDVWFYEVKRSK
ncbi:MAG: hypothetical protein K6A35_00535 [bacterium]|nr:hypothetical protein [bacterium]